MFTSATALNCYLTYKNIKHITVLDKLNLHMAEVQAELDKK